MPVQSPNRKFRILLKSLSLKHHDVRQTHKRLKTEEVRRNSPKKFMKSDINKKTKKRSILRNCIMQSDKRVENLYIL